MEGGGERGEGGEGGEGKEEGGTGEGTEEESNGGREDCHGNFGPTKKVVRGTKIPGKMVCLDHFPLKNLVRTWNNGPSMSTMFDRDCRL